MKQFVGLFLALMVPSVAETQTRMPQEWIVKFRYPLPKTEHLETVYRLPLERMPARDIQPKEYLILAGEAYHIRLQAERLFHRSRRNPEDAFLQSIYKIAVSEDHQANHLSGWLDAVKNDPNLEWIEPNRLIRVTATSAAQSDTAYWHRYLQTKAAWGLTRGNDSVVIGIIDTGVDYLNPALGNRIYLNNGETGLDAQGRDRKTNGLDDDGNGYVDDWRGWDFTDIPGLDDGDAQDPDNNPMDENGHGTAVAGIVSARPSVTGPVEGIAPGCRVMPLRCGTASGWLQIDDIAEALVYAADNRVAVVNMSLTTHEYSALLEAACAYAYQQNVVLIASAGNDAVTAMRYPAGYSTVIAVGATDRDDFLASFSNFGSWLTLTAPGVQIRTTTLNAGYTDFSGTSASAPMVAGVAALIRSYRPTFSNEQVRSALVASADDLGNRGWDPYYGAGRVNAYRALKVPYITIATIEEPSLHQGVSGNTIVVLGTAAGVFLKQYRVAVGIGNNPSVWQDLAVISGTCKVRDTLAMISVRDWTEGAYILRLIAENKDGTVVEARTKIFIDRTPAKVSRFWNQRMLEEGKPIQFLSFSTDDYTSFIFRVRNYTSSDTFFSVRVTDFTRRHSLVVRREDLWHWVGEFRAQAFAEVINSAGMKTRYPDSGYWELDLSAEPVSSYHWQVDTLYHLPRLHLLTEAVDLDSNGWVDLVANELSDQHQYRELKIFEYNPFVSGRFQEKRAYGYNGIPMDLLPADFDGKSKMIIGGGGRTLVLESDDGHSLPKHIIFEDLNDCWGSRFLILPGEANLSLLVKRGNSYQIYRRQSGNSWIKTADISNPSHGTNLIGIPGSVYGDFDRDGNPDLLLADYDGDLYLVQRQGNAWLAVWRDSLPLVEPNGFLAAGDLDGDGNDEFVVGAHTPDPDSRSDPNESYWLFRAYRKTGDHQYSVFWENYFYGYFPLRNYASGLTLADVDAEPGQEILINIYPQAYIFRWNALSQSIEPLWQTTPVRGNGMLVFDPQKDGEKDILLNYGKGTILYRPVMNIPRLSAPDPFLAVPLDTQRVWLRWSLPAGASAVQLWMGESRDSMRILAVVSAGRKDTIIGSLRRDHCYYFSAIAVSDSFQSLSAEMVSAVPNEPPRLVDGAMLETNQIRLRFSEVMDKKTLLLPSAYTLEHHGHPVAVIPSENGRAVVLHYSSLQTGVYRLSVGNLSDTLRTPIDTAFASIDVHVIRQEKSFYVVRADYRGQNHIAVYFNETPERSSAENPSNYRFEPGFQVVAAVMDSVDPKAVLLKVEGRYTVGATGIRYIISVSNVRSIQGSPLDEKHGNQAGLIFTREDLRDIYVYPNPCRREEHGLLTFANLPPKATIRIFTMDGRFVCQVRESDGDGGVQWNLKDDHGQRVPAGVYLFVAEHGKTKVYGKFSIVR